MIFIPTQSMHPKHICGRYYTLPSSHYDDNPTATTGKHQGAGGIQCVRACVLHPDEYAGAHNRVHPIQRPEDYIEYLHLSLSTLVPRSSVSV